MRRAVVACAALLLTLPAHVATAAGLSSGPPPVRSIAAFQAGTPVHVQWSTPGGIDRVIVRFARGSQAPATTRQGRPVPLARPRATRATLRGLVPGAVYSVAVWTRRAGRLSPATTMSFTTKAPRPVIRRTATITGTVTDDAGHPLRDAEVAAYQDFRFFSARTAANGRFELHVSAGKYEIHAGGPAARGGDHDATGYGDAGHTVRVAAGATRTGVNFSLAAAGALRGRVTDLDGNPLRDVRVTWQPPEPYLQSDSGGSLLILYAGMPTARTDASGAYTLKGVSDEAAVPCFDPSHASRGGKPVFGYAQHCADQSAAAAAGQIAAVPTVALSRAPGGTVVTTVTDAAGRPVRRGEVFLTKAHHADANFGTLDKKGRVVVGGLSAGRWQLCVNSAHHGGLGLLPECRSVTVHAGRITRAAVHMRTGGAVSGRLVGPTGRGVPRAELEVDAVAWRNDASAEATTDRSGDFTASGLPTGNYRVCWQPDGSTTPGDPTGVQPGCLGHPVHVVVGRDRIGADHSLPRGGAVSGRVTTAAGAPLSLGFLVLEPAGRGNSYGDAEVVDGRYRATDLKPGRYRVCVDDVSQLSSDVQRCLAHAVTVTRSRTAHVDIQFPVRTTLHVTVTDGAGHPLSGVEVAALRPCAYLSCSKEPVFGSSGVEVDGTNMTSPDGAADLQPSRPGKFAVCALGYYAATPAGASPTGYADKCTGSSFTIAATRGSTTDVTIQLAPGATVTGRVTDGHGHGVPGAQLHLPGSPVDDLAPENWFYDRFPDAVGPDVDSLTDAHGRYTIHSVTPGTAALCARAAKGYRNGCLADPVTTTSGAVTKAPTLTLRPKAAGARTAPAGRVAARTPTRHVAVFDGKVVGVSALIRGIVAAHR